MTAHGHAKDQLINRTVLLRPNLRISGNSSWCEIRSSKETNKEHRLMFSNDFVTIEVGLEKVPFVIHKGFICTHSKFFDAAFNRSFREETTQSVHLPEDDPKIFDVIHKFLYTGLLTIPHEGEDSILSFSECLGVYVMGDKLDLLEACDAATTRISTLIGHSEIISTKSIFSVYERTGSTSLLRRFVVAVMVQNLQYNIDEVTVRKPEALTSHPEILLDLLAQLKHDVTAIAMPTRELKLAPIDVCDYHHHQFHEGKCRFRRKPQGYSEVKLIVNHVTTKRPRFYVVDSEDEEDSDSTDTFRPE
ncbi:MAG: hypothetical protein Q9192_003725 [Flavoplaca navasiana]